MELQHNQYQNDFNLLKYSKNLFDYFNIATAPGLLKEAYTEPHRYFHTLEHIHYILNLIHKDYFINKTITEKELKILVLATWFHDVVYDPTSKTNEKDSVKLWENYCNNAFELMEDYNVPGIVELHHNELKVLVPIVSQIILDTETHTPTNDLSKRFCEYDMSGLYRTDKIHEEEYAIFKEFQVFDFDVFKQGRYDFLKSLLKEDNPHKRQAIQLRIDWLLSFRPRIGVYPGTFNPYHNGHQNITEKADAIFDKVIILYSNNPDKKHEEFLIPTTLLSDKLFNSFDYVKKFIYPFKQIEKLPPNTFLTEWFEKKAKSNAQYVLVKGLRNGDDLAYEDNQLYFLGKISKQLHLNSIFLLCNEEFKYISSSSIRSVAKISVEKSLVFLPEIQYEERTNNQQQDKGVN